MGEVTGSVQNQPILAQSRQTLIGFTQTRSVSVMRERQMQYGGKCMRMIKRSPLEGTCAAMCLISKAMNIQMRRSLRSSSASSIFSTLRRATSDDPIFVNKTYLLQVGYLEPQHRRIHISNNIIHGTHSESNIPQFNSWRFHRCARRIHRNRIHRVKDRVELRVTARATGGRSALILIRADGNLVRSRTGTQTQLQI